jgi:hypothetical protein
MLEKRMNNEEKLDAIYEMTLENNDILRTIRRQHYYSNFLSSLYWIMVLGAIGGAYYFVRPILSTLSGNAGKVEETMSQLNQIRNQMPETQLINQVMNTLNSKKATSTSGQMPDDGVTQ